MRVGCTTLIAPLSAIQFTHTHIHLVSISHRKGEGSDTPYSGKSSKPYLLTLTPDAIHLFTTDDAEETLYSAPVLLVAPSTNTNNPSSKLGQAKSIRLAPGSLLKKGDQQESKPFTLSAVKSAPQAVQLHPEVSGNSATSSSQGGDDSQQKQQTGGTSSQGDASDSHHHNNQSDHGQISKLGVALTQCLSIELFREKRLKICFAAQRPAIKKAEEATLTALKGIFFPVWFPIDAWYKEKWSFDAYLEGHLVKDPGVHKFVIELPTAQEAVDLKLAVEQAMRRLHKAVRFMSLGIPLRSSSTVTMITVDATPPPIFNGKNNSNSSNMSPGTALMAHATARRHTWGPQQQRVPQLSHVIPFPGWGEKLAVPDIVGMAIAHQQAQLDQPMMVRMPSAASQQYQDVVVKIWLNTPLGPAVAEVTPTMLLQSVKAGGAPVEVRAMVHKQPDIDEDEESVTDKSGGMFHDGVKKRVQVVILLEVQPGEPLLTRDAAAALALYNSRQLKRGEDGRYYDNSIDSDGDGSRIQPSSWPPDRHYSTMFLLIVILASALASTLLLYCMSRFFLFSFSSSVLPTLHLQLFTNQPFFSFSFIHIQQKIGNPFQSGAIGVLKAVVTVASVTVGTTGAILGSVTRFIRPGGGGDRKQLQQQQSMTTHPATPPVTTATVMPAKERSGATDYQDVTSDTGSVSIANIQDTIDDDEEEGTSSKLLAGCPRKWYISLTAAELVEQTTRPEKPSVPPIRRMLSVTGMPRPVLSSTVSALEASTTPLPHPLILLTEQHPELVTEDIARRFLVGLRSEVKAYSALSTCINWTLQQGLEGLVSQPQPKFNIIKKHYHHGVYTWSKKKDCILEIEKMGLWPQAYPLIKAEGATDAEILHHLKFTYEYAFKRIDSRPLPDGKSVKIIDLEGLSISAVRSEAFKFISQAGALLALNYPQRLQRAFLVNAPTWWSVAWRLISPMIDAKVRSQMMLLGKNDKEKMKAALLEWVDEDQLPVQYGGTCTLEMGDSVFETEMREYVAKLNSSS